MNSGPEQYEMIEQYLKGKLSSSDKLAFEKRMQEDPSLSEEVSMQKMLNDLVLEKGLSDIRKKVGEDMMPPSGSSFKKPILISLAGILLTAGILYFFLFPNKQENGNEGKIKQVSSSATSETSEVGEDKIKKKSRGTLQTNAGITTKKEETSGELNINESNQVVSENEEVEKSTQDHAVKKEEGYSLNGLLETAPEEAPCPDIKFEVKTGASCANQDNGSLEINPSGIHGGTGPYTYAIDAIDFRKEHSYTGLSAGTHRAAIKDSKGCISQKEIHITEKICFEPKDYSFNPETESWKFPFAEHESGSITITSKNGNVLYTTKVLHGNPSEWNGRTTSGELLGTGTYVYIAQTDKGEVRQGYIVILH